MLDQAFETLKTLDWGTDIGPLAAIDAAINASHGDAAARKELETRLAEVLTSNVSRDAKDYVCRKLMVIGTAASVPALAGLLANTELSHMARYALERIPAPEAGAALRDALGKLSGALKIGVVSSLGARFDGESSKALIGLLKDSDAAVARAAALALGAIHNPAAAAALSHMQPAPAIKVAVTDATLACAEDLLRQGDKGSALMIYKQLAKDDQPKHVRLAATRGMLACAGK